MRGSERSAACAICLAFAAAFVACGGGKPVDPLAPAPAPFGSYEICTEYASIDRVERSCLVVQAGCGGGGVTHVATTSRAKGSEEKKASCGAVDAQRCGAIVDDFRDAARALEALAANDRAKNEAVPADACVAPENGGAWQLTLEGKTFGACAAQSKASAIMEGLYRSISCTPSGDE